MPDLRRLFVVVLLLCAAGAAGAQVRHCVSAEGTDVYTDKRCDQVDAVPAPPRAPVAAGAIARPTGCARTLRDLAFELQAAIDSQDVNRLAASYDWDGMSTRSGYAILERLAAIARRPLVGIVPLYGSAVADAAAGADLADVVHRRPSALRLDQVARDTASPAPTVLSLRRDLGCWWVRF